MPTARTCKVFIFALLMLIALHAVGAWQEPKTLLANANGDGILKVGQEEFKISSVVVKLLEDGKAEIHIVSDITVLVIGTWSRGDDSQNINLELTGGGASSNVAARGKLLLRKDGKSIDRLALQGEIKTRKRSFELSFQAR